MGKKGSWFSALKRVLFTPSSKHNPPSSHVFEKKNSRDKKKWGLNKLKRGETSSFIPLYKEPSSVEKILGDADREYLRHDKHQTTSSLSSRDLFHRTLPPHLPLPAPPPPKVENEQPNRTPLPPPPQKPIFQRPITPIRPAHNSYHKLHSAAIIIQAAYRGYAARRSSRLLKGLMRLQKVMRGQSVKRQTVNAMKCMQWVVRVRTQVHSRRIEMKESRASHRQHKAQYNEQDSILSTWSLTPPQSEKDQQVHEEWDDSQLTKDEIEARLQRKVEAVMKREKALAYAYSHQVWKATPRRDYATKVIRSDFGLPYWWNWIDRDMVIKPGSPLPNPYIMTTPTRPNKQPNFNLAMSDTGVNRTPILSPTRKTKAKASIPEIMPKTPGRDDESMTSCPPFLVPNYMAPTASAKAKVRMYVGSPKAKPDGTPQKKRMSFAQTIGSLKWGKGTSNVFNGKDSASQRKAMDAIDTISVDSALSLPAGLGRKPFKCK